MLQVFQTRGSMSKKKILKFYPDMAGFMTENKDDLDDDKNLDNTNKKADDKEYVASKSTDNNEGK